MKIEDAAEADTFVHEMEGFVDFRQGHVVGDVFVDLDFLHETAHVRERKMMGMSEKERERERPCSSTW